MNKTVQKITFDESLFYFMEVVGCLGVRSYNWENMKCRLPSGISRSVLHCDKFKCLSLYYRPFMVLITAWKLTAMSAS